MTDEQKKATRRSQLLLADIGVTIVIAGVVGYSWGIVPALVAVLMALESLCTELPWQVKENSLPREGRRRLQRQGPAPCR